MANFKTALAATLKNEGGYVFDPQDPGGETYKGVARNMWPKWEGWAIVDTHKSLGQFPKSLDSDNVLQSLISDFYKANFWDKINGDIINDQAVATSIFDFAVNAGVGTSVTIAQMVVGANTDGAIGNETIEKLNAFDPEHFIALFIVAKISRYIAIIKKRPTSQKYLYGWIRRTLND